MNDIKLYQIYVDNIERLDLFARKLGLGSRDELKSLVERIDSLIKECEQYENIKNEYSSSVQLIDNPLV